MKEDYIFYLSPGKGFIFMEKIEISRLVITLLFLLGAIFMFIKSFLRKKDIFNTAFMTTFGCSLGVSDVVSNFLTEDGPAVNSTDTAVE